MGQISPYFSDETVIQSLRKYYKKSEQYNINFKYWLQKTIMNNEGILVNIAGRRFLIDYYTGSVIREVHKVAK